MVCGNKKRQLNKLEQPSINEVSYVSMGANGVDKWDIIKSESSPEVVELLNKAYETFTESINEEIDEVVSQSLWSLFIYTLEDKLCELKWDDEIEKEEKILELTNLFNEFLVNFSENALIKSEELQSVLKAMKTDAGVQYPASSYLYVPDENKVSTWKLRIYDENGNLDKNLLSAAIASFSEGGYRGNQVQLPEADAKTIKEKLRNIWLETYPDKTEDEMPEGIKKEKNMSKTEEFKKACEDFLGKFMPKEDSELEKQVSEKEQELAKAQEVVSLKEAELAEIAKAKEEVEAKLAAIEKQAQEEAEARELEAQEIAKANLEKAEAARKEEFVAIAKEKMSFVEGTPEEVAEKLFAIEKACGEDNKDNFALLLSALEKKSEKMEKLMDEVGSEAQQSDLTKSKKEEIAFEEIAKIQKEQNLSQTEAYNVLKKQKPELCLEETIEE